MAECASNFVNIAGDKIRNGNGCSFFLEFDGSDVYAVRKAYSYNEMICSFHCKETEKLWNQEGSVVFPPVIAKKALTKLRLIDAAICLSDLRIPPGNRLDSLSGNRLGQWSIRVNLQWRIFFYWHETDACDVE